jgi:hypothetical protein
MAGFSVGTAPIHRLAGFSAGTSTNSSDGRILSGNSTNSSVGKVLSGNNDRNSLFQMRHSQGMTFPIALSTSPSSPICHCVSAPHIGSVSDQFLWFLIPFENWCEELAIQI